MQTQKKSQRGLAIITTLMIITLLLALVGAFLLVNRAGNRFTANSIERRTAQDACQSAFTYARFQLELDRTWGTAGNAASGTVTFPVLQPRIRMNMSQVVGPTNVDGDPTDEVTATGVYSPSGDFSNPVGTFTLKVRNNLNSRSPAPGVVPKRAVKVEVVSVISGTTRELNALLRPKPIAHESASAGTNLDLSDVDGLVRIASDDPYSNQIKAGDDIHLPDVSDVRFVKHGVASSGDDLNLGGLNLASASAPVVRSAGETAGGLFSPNSALTNFSDFDPEKYILPPNVDNLPGGEWVFGDITHYEFNPVTVTYALPSGPGPGPPPTDTVGRHQRRESLYNSLTSPDGQVWAATTSIPGSTTPWEPAYTEGTVINQGAVGAFYTADDTGFAGGATPPTQDMHVIAPGLKANVVTGQFVVRSGAQLRFNGDFVVTGEGDRDPELYFGYDMDTDGVAQQESLNDGLEAAQNDPARYMGALVADGDLNVTGGVLGYGSMVAGGQLTIKASSGLRTAPGLGVVVKGQDVVVNPATEPEPTLPGEPVDIDNPIFRDSINNGPDGWGPYDTWLDHDAPTRDSLIQNLGAESSSSSASTLWSTFDSEIGGGGPYPGADLTANGWPGGNVTIEQYVRLKTFYQTKASLYNNGDGQPEWLDFNQKQAGVKNRIENILGGIAQNAESYKMSFQDYLVNPPTDVPDMYIEGIVYADNDVTINSGDGSIKLEGAVVAKDGNLTVNNATKADLVYSRNLLDDLATGSSSTNRLPLETVFLTVN